MTVVFTGGTDGMGKSAVKRLASMGATIMLLGRNSKKTVSERAFGLGFEYTQYFSRLFKSKTGMTPGEFRSA